MAFDAYVNFAGTTVATAPSPATSGTSLTVAVGTGAIFPTPPFNCVAWPSGTQATSSNAEIVRVTAISTDTLTITRAQENTTAQSIAAGWNFAECITAKAFTDLQNAILTPAAGTITGTGTNTWSTLTLDIATGGTYVVIFTIMGYIPGGGPSEASLVVDGTTTSIAAHGYGQNGTENIHLPLQSGAGTLTLASGSHTFTVANTTNFDNNTADYATVAVIG